MTDKAQAPYSEANENSNPSWTFPAGTYFVGDPCYVFSRASWGAVLTASDSFHKNVIEFKGKLVALFFNTAHGQETFGCVPADLIEEEDFLEKAGCLMVFPNPFTIQLRSNGIIRIDNITVELVRCA